MKLSIIIPARNEERELPGTITAYADFFSRQFGDEVEIIAVINQCSDDTAGVASKVAESWRQVKIIVEPGHLGKGGAVKVGMHQACGEFVGYVDGDGSAPPAAFMALVDHIGSHGCIIGSRRIEGAVSVPRRSWMRRSASYILNRFVVKTLFDLQVEDSQCGAKLFRREVMNKVLPELTETGWAFDIELLCRVRQLDYTIKELPVEWHHVPKRPMTFMMMGVQMMASICRVRRILSLNEEKTR